MQIRNLFPPYKHNLTNYLLRHSGRQKKSKLSDLRFHIIRKINRAYYVETRTFSRQHVINTRLPDCDVDETMFVACFLVLGHFVEKQLGFSNKIGEVYDNGEQIGYKGYNNHSHNDCIDLWLWYKCELPRLIKIAIESHPNAGKFNEIEILKDNKLRELIEMRHTLWM